MTQRKDSAKKNNAIKSESVCECERKWEKDSGQSSSTLSHTHALTEILAGSQTEMEIANESELFSLLHFNLNFSVKRRQQQHRQHWEMDDKTIDERNEWTSGICER